MARAGTVAPALLACMLTLPGGTGRSGDAAATPFPNIVFNTHDGRAVRFYDDLVKGRVVMINFMFTTCRRACPGTTANLRKVQRALGAHVGRDVVMLSISLDPEHDTPEVLGEYARVYGVGPGWYLLSGRRSEVEQLRRALGVYDPDPVLDADRTRHAGLVVLGNEPMGRWSAISGLAKPRQVVEAVERVLQAPGDWRPATWSGGRAAPEPCAVPTGAGG